ncbi:uncharacterized protein LOC108675863 [Hyalella azteca]|uniref:Uncharacterized protein LOC108675863 n=1 Tax=Hyalella azteca TaxID=294128 RepID=A0A979FJS8_HYAAZ|nr:uncharacterized protein LOC108675863 [Hyalella azteca]
MSDSLGSRSSDISGGCSVINAAGGLANRPFVRMDVACVIDLQETDCLNQRRRAFEEVKAACHSLGANFHHIQYERVDFGETNVLDQLYNADVAVVDLSVVCQQRSLFYHVGVRESFDMRHTIILYNDSNAKATKALRSSCVNYDFVSYRVTEQPGLATSASGTHLSASSSSCTALGQVIVTDTSNRLSTTALVGGGSSPSSSQSDDGESTRPMSLVTKIKKLLQEVELQAKAHMKEKFLADLRKAREIYSGADLKAQLSILRKRLDDPNILSGDVVLQVLFSLRDIQDYDAMVQLIDYLKSLPNRKLYTSTPAIRYLYGFALNRRNKEGDRERALDVITKAMEKKENQVPDMVCLCPSLFQDKFVESGHTDSESLNNAIYWYRKGFDDHPNEYAGINLATLLVIAGNDFAQSSELQHIGMVLNNLIGKKGSLDKLEDYWDVATFFEISVLAEDYGKAVQAAEYMFKLKPPNWYLKSTIGNITLIQRSRKRSEVNKEETVIQRKFNFWVDFFMDATKVDPGDLIRFPVFILEQTRRDEPSFYQPSYVTVNLGAEEASLQLQNLCIDKNLRECRKVHDWVFVASSIKGITQYKRDERAVFLYVDSDDFQMFFPSELLCSLFYKHVLQLTANNKTTVLDMEADLAGGPIQYEYELDDCNKRVLLGKGTYGLVYAARELSMQVRIAVKEVPEKKINEVQPLHEEIKLHSELRHRNIVQYLGTVSEDGYFKIFMERVGSRVPPALHLNRNKSEREVCAELSVKPKAKNFVNFVSTLRIVDKILCGGRHSVPVIPACYLPQLTADFHRAAGHVGRDKTIEAISRYYFHPRLAAIVTYVVRRCRVCQRYKGRPKGGAPLYRRHPKAPYEDFAVDLLELPPGKGNVKYLLVGIDTYTKFASAVPLRNKRSDTVARALEERIFSTLVKLPETVTSDNGPEFRGRPFVEMLKRNGVKHFKTIPFAPSCNGSVERLNSTLKSLLAVAGAENQAPWTENITRVLIIYNHTVHSQTGRAPADFFTEAAAKLPIPFTEPYWRPPTKSFTPFVVGQRVARKLPQLPSQNKLSPRFSGPFVVTEVDPNLITYRIATTDRKHQKTVHFNQLKPWHGEDEAIQQRHGAARQHRPATSSRRQLERPEVASQSSALGAFSVPPIATSEGHNFGEFRINLSGLADKIAAAIRQRANDQPSNVTANDETEEQREEPLSELEEDEQVSLEWEHLSDGLEEVLENYTPSPDPAVDNLTSPEPAVSSGASTVVPTTQPRATTRSQTRRVVEDLVKALTLNAGRESDFLRAADTPYSYLYLILLILNQVIQ